MNRKKLFRLIKNQIMCSRYWNENANLLLHEVILRGFRRINEVCVRHKTRVKVEMSMDHAIKLFPEQNFVPY